MSLGGASDISPCSIGPTISTVLYLLEDSGDGSRYDAYVFDSLIAEREFLKNVRQMVKSRGGEHIEIEHRIERSIATTLKAAGVEEKDIPARDKNIWPNAQTRVDLLGPTAYSAYRTGSNAILHTSCLQVFAHGVVVNSQVPGQPFDRLHLAVEPNDLINLRRSDLGC